jgi:hypothetical protein
MISLHAGYRDRLYKSVFCSFPLPWYLMNIQSIKTGHVISYGEPDNALRGHLTSSLVAISILFGSMFTAHSAIVELASADLGNRLLSGVETVRTAVAGVPLSAKNRIAHIEIQHRDLIESPFYFGGSDLITEGFSTGITDISQPAALLLATAVRAEPDSGTSGPYFGQIYPPTGLLRESDGIRAPTQDLGLTILSTGEFVRDTLSAASVAAVTNGSLAVGSISEFSEVIISRYIDGIRLWVDGSYALSEFSVLLAYHSGDLIGAAVQSAIPEAASRYDAVVDSWITGAPVVAESLIKGQIQIGTHVIGSLHALRDTSGAIQIAAGEGIATQTAKTYERTVALLEVAPGRVKASVGDFLLLEPKEN